MQRTVVFRLELVSRQNVSSSWPPLLANLAGGDGESDRRHDGGGWRLPILGHASLG